MPDVKLVTLRCPNCGGNLSVTTGTETMSCEYCGAKVMVERDGAHASLRLLSDGIARIQRGTDKAASELALRRLTEELRAERKARSTAEERHRAEDQAAAEAIVEARVKPVKELLRGFLVFLATFVVALIGASLIFDKAGGNNGQAGEVFAAILFVIALGIGALVAGAWMIRRSMARRRLVRSMNEARVASEARYQAARADFDGRIGALEQHLKRHKDVVDA